MNFKIFSIFIFAFLAISQAQEVPEQNTPAIPKSRHTFRVLTSSLDSQFLYCKDAVGFQKLDLIDGGLSGPFAYRGGNLDFYATLPNEQSPPPLLFSVQIPSGTSQFILVIRKEGGVYSTTVFNDEPDRTPAPSIRVVNLSTLPARIAINNQAKILRPNEELVNRLQISTLTDTKFTTEIPNQSNQWGYF